MLRIALLGAGRIAHVHARSALAHPDARLAIVCDPVEDAAATFAAQYDVAWSLDAQDALDDPAIGAVVVASPTSTHTDYVRRAVEAGKKVLCEKPIDLDVATIDALWEAIAGRDPFVMVGFNRRFDPTFADIARRHRAGEIGTVRQLAITSRDPEPPPAAYLAGSGGMFKDMTVHDFDMARFHLGEIVEVTAMGSTNDDEACQRAGDHAQSMLVLRAASGALCTIVNSRSCAYGYDQRLEVFGDDGALAADNLHTNQVRASSARHTDAAAPVVHFFLERYMPAYRAELDEFVTAIQDEREPAVGFRDGRQAVVLAEAADQSVATGTTVAVGE